MSSIYIKGLEAPKDEPIIIKINTDGTVSTTVKKNYKKYDYVSVPNHGRLIDADALMEWGMNDVPYKGSVKRVLIQSPTVIPADIEVMYYPQVEGITPTVVLSRKDIE